MGTPTGRAVIAAAVLGSGMAFLDGTVVNVALKTIGTDLDASFAELQWVTNGYLLSLASLILLGGSLGDRFGRRHVFVVGVVWFAVDIVAIWLYLSSGLAIAGLQYVLFLVTAVLGFRQWWLAMRAREAVARPEPAR